jgi:ClpP class serine protease
MLNYRLAKEIYGGVPWCVDESSYSVLMSILQNAKDGVDLESSGGKLNSTFIWDSSQSTIVSASDFYSGEIQNDPNFKGIGIINIDGPITKEGGASSYGMKQVASMISDMSKDDRISSLLVHCDSGGGSSSAVNIMRDAIIEAKKDKPIYGLIQKGGMACSAMYGIIAACDKIYSEDDLAAVGSCGTMIQFSGTPANSVSPDGAKNVRVYATKSIEKNKPFEEALNKDNYDLLISKMLDPINESFLSNILADRPLLAGSDFESGEDVFAKDAVGTYIDGVKSFVEVVAELSNLSNKSKKSNINQKNKKEMTKEDLRSQFPEVFNSVLNAGIQQEKDRVGTWMAHFDSDQKMVREGIKSGVSISATEREELLIKATANASLRKIENGSAGKIVTEESVNVAVESLEDKELEEFYKNL